jgi:hypothetical protein
MLQAIVTIFGESFFFFWKFVEVSFQNREFVTEFFSKCFSQSGKISSPKESLSKS